MQLSLRIRLGSFLLLLLWQFPSIAQDSWLHASDTFNQKRFWVATGTGGLVYTGAVISLSEIWYDQFERGKFHFFNDSKEWEGVDKSGHAFTAYFESAWAFDVFRWTGMKREKAVWAAAGVSTLLQGTVEVLDGYSNKWGFSGADMAFNTLGVGLFVSQELVWQDQRIIMKVSSSHPGYPEYRVFSNDGGNSMLLQQRVDELYGSGPVSRFIKDYNAQTHWLSFNVSSFMKNENKFPKWLNFAVGYGGDNMFGGFENSWEFEGENYTLDPLDFERTKQFYLSFDVDLRRVKTRSKFLKTLLGALNIIKIPSPTLQLNAKGGAQFYALYF